MIVKGEGSLSSKIWILGEAPGATEERDGRPFVGAAGEILNAKLKKAGIERERCYIDNVMQTRPSGNDFKQFYQDKSKKKPKEILLNRHRELRELVQTYKPNIVIPLGNEPLFALTGKSGILKWRGSILDCGGVKVIPTLHPAFLMRMYTYHAISNLDFARIAEEAKTPIIEKAYNDVFKINPTFDEIMYYLTDFLPKQSCITFDIETIPEKEDIMCMGFGWSKQTALCIPMFFSTQSFWTAEEEQHIIKEIRKFFLRPNIKFIAQNAQYDLTYIHDKWGVDVPGLWMDTMLAFHCCYPELKKSLAFLTSIYTKRPYYKDDGEFARTPQEEWIYNCKDTCSTFECAMAIYEELKDWNVHDFYYKHVHPLIFPLLKMQSVGVLIDTNVRDKLNKELSDKKEELQKRIDAAVGHSLNSNSPKQMTEFLYTELGLPKQYGMGVREGVRKKVLTADEEALENLHNITHNPVLKLVIETRGLGKLLGTYIQAPLEKNNRICCSYKISGTETGRLSSTKSIYGRGTNLQNVPRLPVIRTMFIPDKGHILINADLSQAEARVVAFLAEDEQMQKSCSDELGIHRRTACMCFSVRPEKITESQYNIAKALVHGGNYGIGKDKFAKILGVHPNVAQQYLNTYHNLYMGIRLWHQQVREQLYRTRILITPFGRKRMFYDRPTDDLLREAIAYVPQSTVGDLLNYGIIRSWPNLPPGWSLLMQNHDAVVGQVPIDTPLEYIWKFFRYYYEIPIEIHNKTCRIPIDIKIGNNWGEMKSICEYAKTLGLTLISGTQQIRKAQLLFISGSGSLL